jgi:CheY-like chemotaxis protein
VQIARTGEEAVEAVRESDFDVILMDVQMPGMDGLQATAAIRALPDASRRETPIIAMTAHAMDGDRERFLRAGMDDYVAKPIHGPRLLDFLERRYGAAARQLHAARGPDLSDDPGTSVVSQREA